MIDIIRECGFAAWLSLLLFVGGLAAVFTVGRKVNRINQRPRPFRFAEVDAFAVRRPAVP